MPEEVEREQWIENLCALPAVSGGLSFESVAVNSLPAGQRYAGKIQRLREVWLLGGNILLAASASCNNTIQDFGASSLGLVFRPTWARSCSGTVDDLDMEVRAGPCWVPCAISTQFQIKPVQPHTDLQTNSLNLAFIWSSELRTLVLQTLLCHTKLTLAATQVGGRQSQELNSWRANWGGAQVPKFSWLLLGSTGVQPWVCSICPAGGGMSLAEQASDVAGGECWESATVILTDPCYLGSLQGEVFISLGSLQTCCKRQFLTFILFIKTL